MTILLRHVLRTAATKAPRILAIAAIVGLTMGIHAGVYSAMDTLVRFVDAYYARSNMADLDVQIATDDAVNLADFGNLDGLAAFEPRLVLPGVVQIGQRQVSLLIVARRDLRTPTLNALTLRAGDMAAVSGRSVALERNCAAHYAAGLGQRLDVRLGEDDFTLVTAAIVESPEFLIAPANPSAFLPTDGSLCVVFMELAWLQERLGFAAVNSLQFRYRQQTDPEALRGAILARIAGHSQVEQSLRKVEQFGYLFLDIDLDTFRVFLPAIVAVFALSSAFIVMFLGYQWISAERSQIGMLMALGFSKTAIIAGYGAIALVVAVTAVVLGWPLSYVALLGFGSNYAAAIGMPPPDLALLPEHFIRAALGAAALVTVALAIPLASIFRLAPIDAVRDRTVDGGYEAPARVGRGLAALPAWASLGLRNAVRRPVLSITTCVSIAICLGVTISFSIALTSMERTALDSFRRDRWTAIVDLSRHAWADRLAGFHAVDAPAMWSGFLRGHGFVRGDSGEVSIFVTGIETGRTVKQLMLLAGDMPSGLGVVVEAKLARDLSVVPGDQLVITVEGRDVAARVDGIHSGSVPGEVWVDLDFAQAMFGREGQISGLFYLGDRALSPLALPDVIGVFTKAQAVDAVRSISAQIWTILQIGSLFSVSGAILFVYSNLSFSILAREGEYGMMRVLGFGRRLVAATILVEVLAVTIIAVLLAPAIGYAVGYLLNDRLTNAWFKVTTQPAAWDFLMTLLPALLLVPTGAATAILQIIRNPPADAARTRRMQ